MTFEDWDLKTLFYFTKSFFGKKHSEAPQTNICGKDSLTPPSTHFFLILPFSKFGTEGCPPKQKGGWGWGGLTLWTFSLSSWFNFSLDMLKYKLPWSLVANLKGHFVWLHPLINRCHSRSFQMRMFFLQGQSYLMGVSTSLALVGHSYSDGAWHHWGS